MSAARRTHVLHVIKGLGRGGAETVLVHAQRFVDRERFRTSYVYFLAHKDALADELRGLGGEVTLLPARGSLGVALSARRLAKFARERSVDLIHAHLPLAGVAARRAGRRAGIPVVYTEHSLHERHRPLSRWANLATWGLQSRVIAVSRAVEASILRRRDDVPVSVVPNGVPVGDLVRDADAGRRFRAEHGIPPAAPLVGQIAVFRPEKRLDLWLDAAAALRERVPECEFVLAGDGPERRRLEAHAARLGLPVRLPGLLEDVRPALSAFDVLLISSRFEGLPLVLLEAMASSTAVVATAVGGIGEVIAHAETGLLIERASAENLADAVAGLLRSPDRRARLAAAARDRVVEAYSARAMQRSLEKIYTEVLG